MVYKIVYAQTAEKDLARLSKQVALRIVEKVAHYCKDEDPLKKAKKLKGIETPTYRFRVGDYRAIFRLDPKTRQLVVLVVLRVAHRREVY